MIYLIDASVSAAVPYDCHPCVRPFVYRFMMCAPADSQADGFPSYRYFLPGHILVANLCNLPFVTFIPHRGRDDIKCDFIIFVGDNINWIFYE